MKTFLLVLILIVCLVHLALDITLSLSFKPEEYRAVNCSVVDLDNPGKTIKGTVLESKWVPEVNNYEFLFLIQTENDGLCTAGLSQSEYLRIKVGDQIILPYE